MSNEEIKVCPRCGSTKTTVKQTKQRTGLYCVECSKWLQWLWSGKEIKKAYDDMFVAGDLEGKGYKKIFKYGGNTTIRCSTCNCLLYSSKAGEPIGQFDLINAKFCPNCGLEFVKQQQILSK